MGVTSLLEDIEKSIEDLKNMSGGNAPPPTEIQIRAQAKKLERAQQVIEKMARVSLSEISNLLSDKKIFNTITITHLIKLKEDLKVNIKCHKDELKKIKKEIEDIKRVKKKISLNLRIESGSTIKSVDDYVCSRDTQIRLLSAEITRLKNELLNQKRPL